MIVSITSPLVLMIRMMSRCSVDRLAQASSNSDVPPITYIALKHTQTGLN